MTPPEVIIPTRNHSRDRIVDGEAAFLDIFMSCQAIKQEGNKKSKFLHVAGVTHSLFVGRITLYPSQITHVIYQIPALELE